jgi:hypothetical protein
MREQRRRCSGLDVARGVRKTFSSGELPRTSRLRDLRIEKMLKQLQMPRKKRRASGW